MLMIAPFVGALLTGGGNFANMLRLFLLFQASGYAFDAVGWAKDLYTGKKDIEDLEREAIAAEAGQQAKFKRHTRATEAQRAERGQQLGEAEQSRAETLALWQSPYQLEQLGALAIGDQGAFARGIPGGASDPKNWLPFPNSPLAVTNPQDQLAMEALRERLQILQPTPTEAAEFMVPPASDMGSALGGELGTLTRPDGGVSTELSVTVTDSRLNTGNPTNVPLLVAGQTGVDDLLSGNQPTREQIGIAINRAAERVTQGGQLPSFPSTDEAVRAARARSGAKRR